MKHKTYISCDGKDKITKISGWIPIKTNYNPGKNNHLWDHVCDGFGYHPYQDNFDPDNHDGLFLDYFTFKGVNYAINQFYCMGSSWLSMSPYQYIDEDGYSVFIGSMDMDGDLYINGDTLYLELDEYGENVRLYNIEHIKR